MTTFPNIEYQNSQTFVKVSHLGGIVTGSWIEQSELMLNIVYDIHKEIFLKRTGIIGVIIEKSQMTEEEKTQRVIEAFTNSLWSIQFE